MPACMSPNPKHMPIKNKMTLAINDFYFSKMMSKMVETRQNPMIASRGMDKSSIGEF